MDTFDGRIEDPLSLHKYAYASSNPPNREDPTGQDDFDVFTDICTPVVGWGRLISGTSETDFTPNWRKAVGPITHTSTSVQLGIPRSLGSPSQIANQMYSDLKAFAYFYPPNVSKAAVRGERVFFASYGAFGFLSDRINPKEVAVQVVNGPGQYEISAMTLGHHMLVGIRRWRIVVMNPPSRVIRVETEAYEQSNGELNRMGRW